MNERVGLTGFVSRVQIFDGAQPGSVNDQINKWLRINPDVNVVSWSIGALGPLMVVLCYYTTLEA